MKVLLRMVTGTVLGCTFSGSRRAVRLKPLISNANSWCNISAYLHNTQTISLQMFYQFGKFAFLCSKGQTNKQTKDADDSRGRVTRALSRLAPFITVNWLINHLFGDIIKDLRPKLNSMLCTAILCRFSKKISLRKSSSRLSMYVLLKRCWKSKNHSLFKFILSIQFSKKKKNWCNIKNVLLSCLQRVLPNTILIN